MMSYLDLSLLNELEETNHGTTSVDINLEIKMMWQHTMLTFDVFILSFPNDIACYKHVIQNQDWLYPCSFLDQ